MSEELMLSHRFLMSLSLRVSPADKAGHRLIFQIPGGDFEGPRLKGTVQPSSGDWAQKRDDGSLAIDVRATLKTEDGAIIYMSYPGRIVCPKDIAALPPDEIEKVDPSHYYFRSLPVFETGHEKYLWLNKIVAVGVGRFTATGPFYNIYEIT